MHGNEDADKDARLASEGHHNDSPVTRLPRYLRHRTLTLSISALKESQSKKKAERWKHLWRTFTLCSHSGSRSRLSLRLSLAPSRSWHSLSFSLVALARSSHSNSRSHLLARGSHSRSHLLLSLRLSVMAIIRSPQYTWTHTCTRTRAIATLTFSNVPSSNSPPISQNVSPASTSSYARDMLRLISTYIPYKSQPALVIQDNNLGSSTFGPKDMLPHQNWALKPLSATWTNSPNLPLVHLINVTSEVVLVEVCRTPVPSAFYFFLGLARLHNGNRQLCVGSR